MGRAQAQAPGGDTPVVAVALDQLISAALEHNIPLQLARVVAHISAAGVDVAQGVFQPALYASSTWSKQDLSNDIQTGGLVSNYRTQAYGVGVGKVLDHGTELSVDLQTIRRRADIAGTAQGDYITNMGLSLRQPLLQGFGMVEVPLKAAQLARESAQHLQERAVEVMIAQVVEAYWALAEAEATEKVLAQSVAVADSLLFRNDELFKRELASELDVLTAQSGVAIRQVSLIDAQRARRDASEALVFAVYGERALDYMSLLKTIATAPLPAEIFDVATAEAEALQQRKDLVAAQLELERAELLLSAAKNSLRPSLDIESQLGTQGQAAGFGGSVDDLRGGLNGSVGLRFSRAVRNQTERGQYKQALWQREQQRLLYQTRENVVRQQMRAAVRAVHSARARLAQAKQAESFATRQLTAERKRLDLGLGDSFRVLQTEETVAQAELISVRAQFDLERAMAQYYLALGQLAERHR